MTNREFGFLVVVAGTVLVAAAVYAAGWWLVGWPMPRWRCGDGYWHWRKECNGHDSPPAAEIREAFERDEWIEREDYTPYASEPEAALDEAWVAELHTINADLHTPGSDVLGLGHMSWRDVGLVDVWDWGRRMEAANEAWHDKWMAELAGYDWGLAA